MRRARQADRARMAERASEVNDDKEDLVGELRAAGGGAAARDEAGAAWQGRSLSTLLAAPCGSTVYALAICVGADPARPTTAPVKVSPASADP